MYYSKMLPILLFIALPFLFVGGCDLFENEQINPMLCIDKGVSKSTLLVSIQNGNLNYLESLSSINFESNYKILFEREAPLRIHFKNDFFYYSFSISDSSSAFIKRDVFSGNRLDSISIPKGGQTFQLNTSKEIYISYGISIPYIIKNGKVNLVNFSGVILPIQKVNDDFYTIYSDSEDFFLSKVDTNGFSQIQKLSPFIEQFLPNPGIVYDMFYIPNENRLLFTIEDLNNLPRTYLFDIDLSTNNTSSFLVGDHANIYESTDRENFFLSNQSTLRLNSKNATSIKYYNYKKRKLNEILSFENYFNSTGFVEDLAIEGCSLFISANLFENDTNRLRTLLLKFNLINQELEIINEISNDKDLFSKILSVSVNSNPKTNGGLK